MDRKKHKIIILEEVGDGRRLLRTILLREGYTVFSFDSIISCIENMDQLNGDMLVIRLIETESLILCLNALMAVNCPIPLVIFSGETDINQLLVSIKLENVFHIDNRYDLSAFKRMVKSILEVESTFRPDRYSSYLVGRSSAILCIKRQLHGLAQLNDSILLSGETGTGKETFVRAIHEASGQSKDRFIRIDASSLHGDEDISFLFELKKQQLSTDLSVQSKNGNEKERWTIYLDEVGKLPKHLQAELLLIGEDSSNRYRILAGSSENLERLVSKGRFRKDLYYRLNVLNLYLPPLRERKEDIPLLTDFFLYKFSKEFDKAYPEVSNHLRKQFDRYYWPGNVNELRKNVERIVLDGEKDRNNGNLGTSVSFEMSHSKKKRFENLYLIEKLTRDREYIDQVGNMALKSICWNFMAKVEKQIMKKALESTNWNRKKAASLLNISYKSMLNKIKSYEIA